MQTGEYGLWSKDHDGQSKLTAGTTKYLDRKESGDLKEIRVLFKANKKL
jgi:hypothetical protein